MQRLLDRLRRTSYGELRFRGLERTAVAFEGLQYSCGYPRPRREMLARQVSGRSAELGTGRAALLRRDWAAANAALRTHWLHRPPRFVLNPGGRTGMVSAIEARFPTARGDAARRADRLLEGRYDLLGYRALSFARRGADIDWHLDPVHENRAPIRFWARVPYLDPRSGDHKIIWELNRHQHWLVLGRAAWLTGNSDYARAFTKELRSWLKANPPLVGINWASMLELAFRSLSWVWALHFFAAFEDEDETGWLIDLLLGLTRQLDHVARHLSLYFSPNTHLLGEGLALYVAGRALPELAHAAHWERLGRGVLIREAAAQVNPDGGHAELSTHYHRYALDFYLLALAVARRTGDDAADSFAEVAGRLASFCRALADDEGRLPAIGDDDGGMLFPICGRSPADVRDSLALSAVLLERPTLAVSDPPEEVFWMTGGERQWPMGDMSRPEPACRLFPNTGYAVLSCDRDHAILDAGPHGFLNGGHAHADALSLVLSLAGRPLAIDPGTATYTMDREVRDRFRSTAMHNTVVVDGRHQSVPSGPFHWRSRANARVIRWVAQNGFACVEGEHDGYLPLVHRRTVTMAEEGLWLVADHILGQDAHRADAYWHLAEGWLRIPRAGGVGSLTHPDGVHAAIVSTAGDPQEFFSDPGGLGWFAPVYGQMLPSCTLRFAAHGSAPFSMITALAGGISPVRLSIASLPVAVDRPDGWHRTAVQVTHGDATIVALYATPAAMAKDHEQRRGIQRISAAHGQLATDARVAVVRFARGEEPLTLRLLDATHATWTGRSVLEIPPCTAAQDLHFDLDALRRLSRAAEARPVG